MEFPRNHYRVLIGQKEKFYASERQVTVGEILTLQGGERVVVREILGQPSPKGPGIVRAEPAGHFRPS